MDRARRRRCWPALAAALAGLAFAPAASAHVVRAVGPYEVEIGWGSEPPIAGFENFAQVTVTRDGEPVADLGPDAAVEVGFGDAAKAIPLVASETPGEFHATIVPTRPGTYSLRVDATVEGRDISTGATCSQGTFDCVIGPAEVQFPVADPTAGEIAGRVESVVPRTEAAADDADAAKRLAIAALAIAAIALGGAIVLAIRSRRRNG